MAQESRIHPLRAQLRHTSEVCAWIVLALGVAVLVGWFADISLLKSILPQWVSMKANTALSLVLCGGALLAVQQGRADRPWLQRVAQVAAVWLALLALAVLVQFVTGKDLGIDQLLVIEPPGTPGSFAPGRMAANAAMCFVLLAASILAIDRKGSEGLHVSEGLGIAAAALSGQNILGYLLKADFAVGAGAYTRMALHTAVGCLLASIAVLTARPERGWAGVLAGSDTAGKMARRLLPTVILAPIILEMAAVLGVREGVFDEAYGSALHVVLLIPVLASIMILLSRSLGRRTDEVASLAETVGRSEERLQATLRSIGDGVIATDSECRVEAMNPVAELLTGWSLAEARGRLLSEVFHIVHEDTRQEVESPAERVLREGRVVGLANHTALIARHGTECPIADSGAPIRGKDGHISGVVLVFRDGTEERRFATELMERERRYRQLFGEMLDGFALHEMVWDEHGQPVDYRFLAVNRAFEAVTGLTEANTVGRTVRDVLPGIEAAWIERYGEVVRTGEPVHFEMTSAPLRSTYEVTAFRPAPNQFACIFTDITERRALQAKIQVADRMMSVGTLAAGVAHEINNPLAYTASNITFVVSELQGMLAAGDPTLAHCTPRVREVLVALEDAREGAQRVGRIVRDLKTFSRADSAEPAQANVENVLDLSLRLAGNQIRARAQIVREFAGVPTVKAAESRLGQVFVNLLVNAAQAIREGNVEGNEIRVSTKSLPGGRVVVEVRDSGVGMTPEVMAHVFDPFFTTKAVGEGTGLGLSICHGIITSLGGEITFESTPGIGTVARVVLPVAEAHAALPPAPPAETPAPSARILIIDDEPSVAKALKRLIGKVEDVAILTDAREALQRIEAGERYDLIVSDLMMPAMTGMDLHRALLARQPEQAARMVFVTGDAFTQEARAFLAQFPGRHLEKPFDLAEIRRVVREVLDQ